MTRADAKRLKRMRQIEEVHALADRFLAQARRASGRSPGSIALVAAKPARRHREIRANVFARAAGCCEWGNHGPPQEWHHIIGGGLRRKMESEETTAAICIPCHRGWEKADLDVLLSAAMWAAHHGFTVAAAAIERRRAKVEEARRQPSVPVRVVVGRVA